MPYTQDDTAVDAVMTGLAGALALTAVHQVGQALIRDAPRMDVVGMRAMAGLHRAAGFDVPPARTLFWETLAGDLASNAVYYSVVAAGDPRGRWRRGAALGLAAGLGALVLPRPLGLGDPPHSHRTRNQLLTVAWYTIGGLAAAAVASTLRPSRELVR